MLRRYPDWLWSAMWLRTARRGAPHTLRCSIRGSVFCHLDSLGATTEIAMASAFSSALPSRRLLAAGGARETPSMTRRPRNSGWHIFSGDPAIRRAGHSEQILLQECYKSVARSVCAYPFGRTCGNHRIPDVWLAALVTSSPSHMPIGIWTMAPFAAFVSNAPRIQLPIVVVPSVARLVPAQRR
jgi:hypothetical protein